MLTIRAEHRCTPNEDLKKSGDLACDDIMNVTPLYPPRGFKTYPSHRGYKLAGPGKKLLENLEGCISTRRELGLATTHVDISVQLHTFHWKFGGNVQRAVPRSLGRGAQEH
jgi:hypothetical protein